METGERNINFTEKEKMLLIEVAQEFLPIIDNKKMDVASVDARKKAWTALTCRYNAVSETGRRNEKQLQFLFYNLKNEARSMNNDNSEPGHTGVSENVVGLPTTQVKLEAVYDSNSSAYYNDIEIEDNWAGTSQNFAPISEAGNNGISKNPATIKNVEPARRTMSPRHVNNTESIDTDSSSTMRSKVAEENNINLITAKRLEILELQRRHEIMKYEKTKTILDLDIALKRTLLETAQVELELKKKMYNL